MREIYVLNGQSCLIEEKSKKQYPSIESDKKIYHYTIKLIHPKYGKIIIGCTNKELKKEKDE